MRVGLGPERTYTDAEVTARLESLPHWTFSDGSLERTYRTAGFKGALLVAMSVGHLCEAAWHHPEMVVGYGRVTVKLSTHSARGITEKDFALAAKIEEMIGWRPGGPDSALRGTPDDPRHAYIQHD